MQFFIGALVGWFLARNPGVVQNAVQTAQQGGGVTFVPGSGGGIYVSGSGVAVTPGPAVQDASGVVPWAGCPTGQMAVQDPYTGRIYCAVIGQ